MSELLTASCSALLVLSVRSISSAYAKKTNVLFDLIIRVLLKKLTVPQLLKTFHALYGTRRFIAVF